MEISGLTPYKLISAATTNGANVKASRGRVGHISVFNKTATIAYLKFYDKATAPTVGTDVPVLTYPIPASTSVGGIADDIANGYQFTNGIGIAITGGIADNDTTAVTANDIVVNLGYR